MASSSAFIERGRPTNRGITMCGNTTTSRRGSRGRSMGSEVRIWLADIITFLKISAIDAKGKPGPPFSDFLLSRWWQRRKFQASQPRKCCEYCSGCALEFARGLSRLALRVRVVFVNDHGHALAGHSVFVEHHLLHVLQRRQLVHRVQQGLFHDGPQAACTGTTLDGTLGY